MNAESTGTGCLIAFVAAIIFSLAFGPIIGIIIGLCAGFIHFDWAAKEFQKRLRK